MSQTGDESSRAQEEALESQYSAHPCHLSVGLICTVTYCESQVSVDFRFTNPELICRVRVNDPGEPGSANRPANSFPENYLSTIVNTLLIHADMNTRTTVPQEANREVILARS